MQRSSMSGFISRRRSAMTSVLGRPTVDVTAQSWRLILLSPTVSRSMRVMRPMPERARASAHQEPTPPRPITATWLLPSFSIASCPSSISARMVLSFIWVSFLKTPPVSRRGQHVFSFTRRTSYRSRPWWDWPPRPPRPMRSRRRRAGRPPRDGGCRPHPRPRST